MDDRTSKRVARREMLLPGGAALVTVTLWASAFVGIRAAGNDLSPGALSLARLLVGSLALGALIFVRRERFPARRDLPAIALCGALWFGLYNVMLNSAERLVDAGTAAMLVGVAPVLIAVFAGVLLKEGFPRSLFAGCAVAFAGVVIIGLATSGRGFDAGLGAVLCLVAAFAYASGVVIQKPLLGRASGLQVTWIACSVGAIACLPFAPALLREVGEAGAPAVGWAVYLGVFPTALAFSMWAYALSRTTAGRMAAITYLVPSLAVLMGWVALGEVPPPLALLGGALCLAGVAVSRR